MTLYAFTMFIRFLWLLEQAGGWMIFVGWPITIGVLVFLAGALYLHYRNKKEHPPLKFLAAPVIVLLLINLAGTLFIDQYEYRTAIIYGSYIIYSALLVYAGLAIYDCKNSRLLLLAYLLPIYWYGFWIVFINGMSISGDWI